MLSVFVLHVLSMALSKWHCAVELSKLRPCRTSFEPCFASVISLSFDATLIMRLLKPPSLGCVYHNRDKSSNRGNCFWLPDQWQYSNLYKEDLNMDHTMYQSDNVVLGQRYTTIICLHCSSFPPYSLISSNLPAEPLRQQHFCMEQQLQHLCEGRPFDVLCVDNAQKCFTCAASKREGERDYKK